MHRSIRGFTLFELMMVLLVGVVVAGFAVDALGQLVLRTRVESAQRQLQDTLESSRYAAQAKRRHVTLCGTLNGSDCDASWKKGLLVFDDSDRDGTHDAGERVLSSAALANPGIWLEWRSFRSDDFLQWNGSGYTTASNGTFTLCNAQHRKELLRQLVINRTGRVRVVKPAVLGGNDLAQAMRACDW